MLTKSTITESPALNSVRHCLLVELGGQVDDLVQATRAYFTVFRPAATRTLQRADWNTTVVRDVVPDEVATLKAQPGGDLALGGADLAAVFMEHDLIDEYRVYVHPVLIDKGKPLFPRPGTRVPLHLTETRTFGNGVVLLRYQRPDPPGTTIPLSQRVTS